jgi:hypothetical protein
MIVIQRVVWFLSPSLGELDKNHIKSQNMGDSFYHIFTTNIPILYTLFFESYDHGKAYNGLVPNLPTML